MEIDKAIEKLEILKEASEKDISLFLTKLFTKEDSAEEIRRLILGLDLYYANKWEEKIEKLFTIKNVIFEINSSDMHIGDFLIKDIRKCVFHYPEEREILSINLMNKTYKKEKDFLNILIKDLNGKEPCQPKEEELDSYFEKFDNMTIIKWIKNISNVFKPNYKKRFITRCSDIIFWLLYPINSKKIQKKLKKEKKKVENYNERQYKNYLRELQNYKEDRIIIPKLIDNIIQNQKSIIKTLEKYGYTEEE